MILGDIQVNTFHFDSHIYFTDTITENLRNILSSIMEDMAKIVEVIFQGLKFGDILLEGREKSERRIRGGDERNEDNDSFIKTRMKS